MSDEKICVASADGHVGAPTLVYKDYLEKRHHRDFDEFYAKHQWRWSPSKSESFFPREFHDSFVGTEGYDPEVGSPIAWDPEMRLKAYDSMGVACDVLFPDDQSCDDPPFGCGLATAHFDGMAGGREYPPELMRVGARAYNRWMTDFCSPDRDRLRGLTMLGTLDDVSWAVDEVYRAYDAGLRTGILLPLDYYLPLYHHPRYDMLWETCVELNLSVAVHFSKGNPHYLDEDPWVQRFMYFYESFWFAKRPLWCLIFGGVLERYPDLKLVFTELGSDWVGPQLAELDNNIAFVVGMQASRDVERKVELSLKPSEYWARQCFVAHTASQMRHEIEGAAFDAAPNMVFGTDVGHGEGFWPVNGLAADGVPCEDAIRDLVHDLPAGKMLDYLSNNFFRAYPSVSKEALAPVVERIGPTLKDLGLAH